MKNEGIYEAVNRKRDNIIRDALTDVTPAEYNEAVTRMEDYLRSQKKRCTIERRYVLEMLYRHTLPVDINTLHDVVCQTYGNVALTTVYNTLELLTQLHLARRIELLDHGMAFFERTLGVEPHGFVVCEDCGSIRSVRLSAPLQEQLDKQLPKGFGLSDTTLIMHGLCAKCQRARNKVVKPRKNKTTKSK